MKIIQTTVTTLEKLNDVLERLQTSGAGISQIIPINTGGRQESGTEQGSQNFDMSFTNFLIVFAYDAQGVSKLINENID